VDLDHTRTGVDAVQGEPQVSTPLLLESAAHPLPALVLDLRARADEGAGALRRGGK
jgi:hypothetical protein